MCGRELQSVAVAGNGSVLVWLWLVASPMAVLGIASQRSVTLLRCGAVWPCGQTMSWWYLLVLNWAMNVKCCPQPGQSSFCSVLLLDYLFCCWLAGRAYRHSQVNHYRLLVRCKEQRAEVELVCGEVATGHVGVPTGIFRSLSLQGV